MECLLYVNTTGEDRKILEINLTRKSDLQIERPFTVVKKSPVEAEEPREWVVHEDVLSVELDSIGLKPRSLILHAAERLILLSEVDDFAFTIIHDKE